MAKLDDYLVPTTELQAVNLVLEASGERPVATLVNPGLPAMTAINRLGESNRETQTEGWSFNTDEAYPLAPAVDGTISLPEGTLRIRQVVYDAQQPSAGAPAQKPPGSPVGMRLVRRGQKLYDRVGNTFNIGRTVYVDLTTMQPFEALPEAARWYITMKAARRNAAGKLVSGTVYQFTKTDEDTARLRMEQDENEATYMETLGGNPHIQDMRRR